MSYRGTEQWTNQDPHEPFRLGVRATLPARVVALMVMFLVVASACGDIRMRMGARPKIDPLEQSLRLGESTQADVLALIGPPNGKGASMLPVDPKPKTMWSYYYEEGTVGIMPMEVKASGRIFLFVYFDGDRYDGYLWFSSLPK